MEMTVSGSPVKEKKEKKKYGKYEEYDIRDDARTIQRAEEIKADKDKMKYVKMCLEEKAAAAKKAVTSIQDIRDAAKDAE